MLFIGDLRQSACAEAAMVAVARCKESSLVRLRYPGEIFNAFHSCPSAAERRHSSFRTFNKPDNLL
ncbi:hypothetical protein ACVMB2_005164 [Sinorhizobium meliloti]